MRRHTWQLALVKAAICSLLSLAGCGASSGPGNVGGDADTGDGQADDAGADADVDGGLDAGSDAGADALSDAGIDAGSDAGADARSDAGVDAGSDAGADAWSDAGVDAGADAGSDAGLDAGADGDGEPPAGVLIFYGHSGVGPNGIYGYGKHGVLASRYEEAGLTVDYTPDWPQSLSAYRLVLLAVPGCSDSTDTFSDAEVSALSAFLDAGGTLFVENEKAYYAGTVVINDLLERLGSAIRQQSDTIGSGGYYGVLTSELGNHPLLDGVSELGFGEASRVLAGSGTEMVCYQGECVMAAQGLGAGTLVVSGDQQFLDDHGLQSYPPDGAHNLIFADNLAQLPSSRSPTRLSEGGGSAP
ncbi:MAG: hypothetical protein JXR96_27095 [Deltaproteobacteria bacterium]|nr:hypothetical protein [Deltaproteobacteria bacterium]